MRAIVTVLVLALAATETAFAAPKPIRGKLSKSGYTVIALADTGKARIVRADTGRFSVRPPKRWVTLQLRRPDGVYAGPVVLGRRKDGRRALVVVRAGARLGAIRVRRGYATVTKRPAARRVDQDAVVRARRGKPIGAGRFGRVRSRRVTAPLTADRDIDGVPDVLDVDDDGDLILDKVDRSATRAAQAEERFDFHTRVTLTIDQTANANAAGLSGERMDTALSTASSLLLTVLPGDDVPNSPELDCGGSIQDPPRPIGLVYCRPHASGGTGTVLVGPNAGQPFPDCCDLDDDGLGKLTADTGQQGQPKVAMTIHHGATSDEIKTGDVMIQRVIRDGAEIAFLGAIQYVFASVPAVRSYRGETGPEVTVQYPYTPATDPDGPGPLPTRPDPIAVADGPDADDDVELTFTLWRPQRAPVEQWGEAGWIDIGRLQYNVQAGFSGLACPQDAFAEDDDEIASSAGGDNPGVTDLIGDRPTSRSNTFTFDLNLSRCLESNGFSFANGEERALTFVGRAPDPGSADNGQQAIWFERQQ